MRFVLNYNVEDVLITLSVEADTPEQGEVKMKRCVAKMLKGFPVGLLFGQAQDLFNSPNFLLGQWQGNTPEFVQGALGGYQTVPNNAPYTVTIGGQVTYGPNGEFQFSNMVTSSGILTSNVGSLAMPPINGSFTFTASSAADGIGNNQIG